MTPTGGTWGGLLFENANTGYPLALSYTFTFDFAEVSRDYGSVSPNLVIDWIPAGDATWHEMTGQHFSGSTFGDPVEASVYFFEHHRYECADMTVVGQEGSDLAVRARIAGDIDGLGLADIRVEETLTFQGLIVHTEGVGTDIAAARKLIGRFTDITGLQPQAARHNVVFVPSL